MAINNVTRVIKKTSQPKLVHRFDSAIGAKYISTFKGVNTEFVHFYYNRRSNPLNVYRYISINKEHAQTLLTETHPTYGSHDERKISLNFPSGLNNNIILQYGTVTDFLFDDETYISYQDENKIVYGTSLIRAGAYGARIASTFFGYMIIKSINTDYTQFEVCGFIPLAVGEATDTPNAALLKFNNNWYFFGRKRGSINSAGNKDWGKSPYNETTESTFDETTIWQDRRGIKLRKASSLNGTWDIVNPGTGGVLDYANTSTETPDKYDPLYYTNSNASETPSNQLANEFILNNICENYYGVSGFKIDNTFLLLMDSFFQNRLRIVPTENDNGGAVYDPFKGTGEEYPTLWLWKSNDYAYRVKDDNGDYKKTIAPDGEDTNTVNDLEVGLNTNTIPGFKRKWYSPIKYERDQKNSNNEEYRTIPEFGQLKISSIVDAGNIYLVYWAHRLDTHYREILRYSNESQHEGKYTTKQIDLLGQTRSHPASNSESLSESYTYANNMRTAVATAGFLNNRFQKPTFAYVTEIPKNRFASWKYNGNNAYVDTKTLTIPANADYLQINHLNAVRVDFIQNGNTTSIGEVSGDNLNAQLAIPSNYKGQSVKLRFNLLNTDSELFAFNFARIKPVSTGFQLKTPTNEAIVPNAWTVFKWDAVPGETPETVYTVGITGDTNTNSPNDRIRTRSSFPVGQYNTVLTATNSTATATAPSHSITIVEAVVSVNKDQITFYRSEGVSNYKVQFSTTPFPSNVNDPFTPFAEITFTYQADIDGLYPSGSITESLTSLTFPSGTIYCRMRAFVPGDDLEERPYVSSTYRTFTVAQSLIEAPTLLSPSNGGDITTSGNLQFTHVTSTPNVTSYGIQFSTSSNFNADKILVLPNNTPPSYEYTRTTGGGRLVGNTMTVPVDTMGVITNPPYLNQFIYWRVRVKVVDGITLDESQTTWSQSRQIMIKG